MSRKAGSTCSKCARSSSAPGIRLLDQHPVGLVVPDAAPGLIGPRETEGEVGLTRLQHLRVGALEDAASGEPVVPVAERLDAVAPRQGGLCLSCLGEAQVVEAEVGGQMRLLVPAKERPSLRGIRPLREAGSPPLVVLRDRMKLGKVEGKNSCSALDLFVFRPGRIIEP